MELKQLDLKESSFEANGKKYQILKEIPLSRYIEYQKMVPKLTYGLSFAEMFKNLSKAYEAMNKNRMPDAAVVIHNMMNGIAEIENENRHDSALQICTLFIIIEGEDLGKYDKDIADAKIQDWGSEGYGINGFFHLALATIEGFRKTFSEYILKG